MSISVFDVALAYSGFLSVSDGMFILTANTCFHIDQQCGTFSNASNVVNGVPHTRD